MRGLNWHGAFPQLVSVQFAIREEIPWIGCDEAQQRGNQLQRNGVDRLLQQLNAVKKHSRSIHAVFHLFSPGKAHGYCVPKLAD
jgi:hypothetical protein